MANIVSLGSALQDIYLIDRDDFVPTDFDGISVFANLEIGTKVDIDRVSYQVGGGGTNSAVTFARNGHASTFLGNLGHDPAGEAVRAVLDQEGVNTSYITTFPRKHTGCSILLLDAHSGERTILTHRGASAHFDNLSPTVLDAIRPDWLYATTLHGDTATALAFFEKAKQLGTKIMFNPGELELKTPKQLIKLLTHTDILLVNKHEAAEIVPGTLLPELLSRLNNYVETVIITDGAMGGIASDGRNTYRFGLYEDLKVKDTTGAGDAFGSGFLAALAAGRPLKDALVFASANSTSVVSKLGSKPGILTPSEKLHPMPIQELI